MQKLIASLVILLSISSFVGCAHQNPKILHGKYSSEEDHGVFIFRKDGTFGYKFAAKFDPFTENNLPPYRGRYQIIGNDVKLEISPEEPSFGIEIIGNGESFILIRKERNGTLPNKALYSK